MHGVFGLAASEDLPSIEELRHFVNAFRAQYNIKEVPFLRPPSTDLLYTAPLGAAILVYGGVFNLLGFNGLIARFADFLTSLLLITYAVVREYAEKTTAHGQEIFHAEVEKFPVVHQLFKILHAQHMEKIPLSFEQRKLFKELFEADHWLAISTGSFADHIFIHLLNSCHSSLNSFRLRFLISPERALGSPNTERVPVVTPIPPQIPIGQENMRPRGNSR